MLNYCQQNIRIILPCEPFKLCKDEIDGDDLHLYFEPSGEASPCPTCGDKTTNHKWRKIELDAPRTGLHKKTVWHVNYRVLRCSNCDCFSTEEIPFRFGGSHVTTDLAKEICSRLENQNGTVKSVADDLGLSWHKVKNVHKEYLKQLKDLAPEPEAPEICSVDEFAVEKNHRYATLVIDTINKLPLYLHQGNAAKDFRPFFSEFSTKFYRKIKAFSMDQNASYSSVVRECLPKCKIVCDYFHMMKNYTDEVLDKVRGRAYRSFRLEGNHEAAERLKHAKRLLNKRFPDEITKEEDWEAKALLQTMMDDSHELDVCIHMREMLQDLYDNCRDRDRMKEGWSTWCRMAKESRIPELMRYAKNKVLKTEEILNHADFPITSGVIEGCMNKIKVLKRVAFGFRDFEYFFMRIWQAFLPSVLNRNLSNMVWGKYQCY